ncbi:polyketide biosynthesis acyl carrier protein [Stackebrandtia endophytica]|uniref:Polyketide biosynthesis acyl carrier protein n=1 Tax=Stackebrandtia endophytica TaxID=1496996 RepID=A0A543ARU9_9ACTN|nr:polyketide biosynthesis acyl carrier protein [Stackebrandtia endophytica]
MSTVSDPSTEPILVAVREAVAMVVPEVAPELVAPGRTLTELGCNSIDRAEIVTIAMERLRITVPIGEFAEVGDIASLVDVLRRHHP